MSLTGFFGFNISNPISWIFINMSFTFVTMSIGWYFCEKIKNATFVDVIWSISFAILAAIYSIIGTAPSARKIILLASIVPWSLRLFAYLLYRTIKKSPQEDKRYAKMRIDWGDKQSLFMYLVFQFQGVLIALLSLPFAASAFNQHPQINFLEIVGAFVCLLGLIGEAIADYQKFAFVSQKANSGKTCDVGLWYYSRHPNYFFEWVVWLGIFLLVFDSPKGYLFIYCPAVMYYLLTEVSGVKLSEALSLASRGEEYKRYQKTTSSFFPWFKIETDC